MTGQEIKAALVAKGIKQTEIARRVGHSQPFVNDVITRKRRSPAIERAIAEAIGKPLKKVFPELAA